MIFDVRVCTEQRKARRETDVSTGLYIISWVYFGSFMLVT